MPKAKEKIKSAERHDRGKSWTSEEKDLLVDFWSREEIKEKLDGTVRAVIAHEPCSIRYVASFVFKASARWSLFTYLSRRIVGN